MNDKWAWRVLVVSALVIAIAAFLAWPLVYLGLSTATMLLGLTVTFHRQGLLHNDEHAPTIVWISSTLGLWVLWGIGWPLFILLMVAMRLRRRLSPAPSDGRLAEGALQTGKPSVPRIEDAQEHEHGHHAAGQASADPSLPRRDSNDLHRWCN